MCYYVSGIQVTANAVGEVYTKKKVCSLQGETGVHQFWVLVYIF